MALKSCGVQCFASEDGYRRQLEVPALRPLVVHSIVFVKSREHLSVKPLVPNLTCAPALVTIKKF